MKVHSRVKHLSLMHFYCIFTMYFGKLFKVPSQSMLEDKFRSIDTHLIVGLHELFHINEMIKEAPRVVHEDSLKEICRDVET